MNEIESAIVIVTSIAIWSDGAGKANVTVSVSERGAECEEASESENETECVRKSESGSGSESDCSCVHGCDCDCDRDCALVGARSDEAATACAKKSGHGDDVGCAIEIESVIANDSMRDDCPDDPQDRFAVDPVFPAARAAWARA